MKKLITLLITGALVFSAMGCSTATTPAAKNTTSQNAPTTQNVPTTQNAPAASEGAKTELTFWHSMGGAGGEGIKKMVDDFNAQSETIRVTEQYQGSYDDAITKLKSSAASGQGPEIMQLYDIGTRWMIDSGYAIEMQTVIDRDTFDVSQIEPNIAAYYSVNDRLHSMPFNSSTPLMYYNKDAFKAAGLDPDNPPKNFDELEAAATTLTSGDKVGMGFHVYSWLFEQYCSKQGKTFANGGNGRTDKATAVEFDSNGAALEFFTRMYDFNKKGINANFGRDGTAAINAFGSGQISIAFGSTASLPSVLAAVDGAFELGTAPLPDLVTGVDGGVSIGGGSLWIMDKGSDETEDAAWQFVKYCVGPEVQVYWHKQTGYFPITTKAYDVQEMKDQIAENKQFVTAIDQLHASNPGAAGALLGVFTEARGIIEANWEDMLADKLTPQQAVDNSAKAINAAIEQYNIAND